MTVQRDVGLQFTLIKEILDPKAQKRQMEEKNELPRSKLRGIRKD